jgi:hypothetical protein
MDSRNTFSMIKCLFITTKRWLYTQLPGFIALYYLLCRRALFTFPKFLPIFLIHFLS